MSTFEPIIATFNETALPPPASGQYFALEGKYYGVGWSGGTAIITEEDNTQMPSIEPFNVMGPYRTDCSPY